MAAVWAAPPIPGILLGYPVTTYSIEYDICTLANELDMPAGWHSPRGAYSLTMMRINYFNTFVACIYHRIICRLNLFGFTHNQYSIYVQNNTTAAQTYGVMVNLEILSQNKFSSTVKNLRMSCVDNFAVLDVSANMWLGGGFVTRLFGPVPANLVAHALTQPGGVLNLAPVPTPAANFARPVDNHPGGASLPANFIS